jgi:UTP--glucose-1-phosphate uridylyltransferase
MASLTSDGLQASVQKMRRAGVPDAAIDTFSHYHGQLRAGASGLIPDTEIVAPEAVADLADLPQDPRRDRAALDRAVTIKLNGGLGTSMGITRAKSLLEVKEGLTFLDVIVRQTLELRRRFGARLPLVLMNSFYTREDTLAHLARYPELEADVPLDFVQNKEPKIRVDDLQPVEWPQDPSLEWCPPGHGDLYTALHTSGTLQILLDSGYEYAFVANADNLGAVLEPRLLGWFARGRLPFVMEVADRTGADRKGGHLAARRDGGGLLLRELAQVPEEDLDSFQDVGRYAYFNTNNLWVNLRTLSEVLARRDNVLGLPMIVNRKTVDPADKSSPAVFQLETAMGAAIGVFEGAQAVRVPRSRFAPVKTTNDLLALRSDAYVLTNDARMELAPERDGGPPLVDLDPDFYRLLGDFDARFPAGPPSLVECRRLTVRGDVSFGAGVVVRGAVEVVADGSAPTRVGDGTLLQG